MYKADHITDFGFEPQLENTATGEVNGIGRYGVWGWTGRKMEVIDTGNDLEALLKKHNLTKDKVQDLSHLIPQPKKGE
tara:strand:+ start:1141 stop:1374 length:234 start_codon:yes stop_codon:yes gene_type:complete